MSDFSEDIDDLLGQIEDLEDDDDAKKGSSSNKKKTVLVCEDSEYTIELIMEFLTGYMYNVEVAKNGKTAVYKTETMKPDMILMDISMPVMNGIEAVKNIRQRRNLKTIPIIMLSAFGTNQYIQEAISAGATDFIVKPFKMDTLLEKIQKHI